MASSYSNYHPVDQILSNLAQEAVQGDDVFIADKIFENVQIPERSGTLLIEASRNYTGAGAGLSFERAPGSSRANIAGFDRSSTTYKASIYGAQDSIAREELEDSQFPGSEEQRLVKKVSRVLKLDRERRAAALLFDTSVYTTITPGTKFDAAGGDPLNYLHGSLVTDAVYAASHGNYPDTMILGHDVFRALSRSPEVRGIAGSVSAGLASGKMILTQEETLSILRAKLNIPNIFIGDARRDTAVAGATSAEAFIWEAETIWVGILKGSDAITNRSGVKLMPVSALNFAYKNMTAGQYDSLDMTRRYVWAEESGKFQVIDANYGILVNNCLT